MARSDLTTLLALALTSAPTTVFATDASWSTPTSAPEGHAVCVVSGSIKKSVLTEVQVSLAPTSGEAVLRMSIGPKKSPSPARGLLAAGTQPGCDIFPDVPTTLPLALSPKATVLGVLDLHAHPGSDCGAAGVSEGTVTVDAGPVAKTRLRVRCDADVGHANIELLHAVPALTETGVVDTQQVRLVNHGPGTANGARVHAKLPRKFFFRGATPTQGHCLHNWRKGRVECEVGDVPPFQFVDVDIDVIALKEGTHTTGLVVGAGNAGDLLDDKAKVKTDVAQGSSAILSVDVKCKGAGGTVTIDPNGAGGTTTCTCPDPNDATREVVRCVEIYGQATTVTLTPAATKGAFTKWTGACAGNAAACSVQVDPNAQNPDVGTTAKFK